MRGKKIPDEILFALGQRLEILPERSAQRRSLVRETADLFGVSEKSVYRYLRDRIRPKSLRRSDHGVPRIIAMEQMEQYCEIIAALKIRTSNKKGRHLSTSEAIRLLEEYGVETPDGVVKAPKGLIKKPTINRYLTLWGYDQASLAVQQAVVRFQARHSNECWQFDLSVSDLKKLDVETMPPWVKEREGRPNLMLYSVVDDRSGIAYQEYHVVYGEDVGAALRFLFNAMSPKEIEGFPFQGIPQMIYMDNGPIAKSGLFRRVMKTYLGVEVRCHMPRGKGGRRTTAQAKGKVERPFRDVKEVHETLYHFHTPTDEKEANEWLLNYLLRYNEKDHRSEPHSRLQDWIENLPSEGIRAMCSWERFCVFAREPDRRSVGPDARVSVEGVAYEVNHELAGQEVVIWWGLFDNELFVEFEGNKFGPYRPLGGPVPLHRYRAFKKTEAEKRAEKIEALAAELRLPREALTRDTRVPEALRRRIPDDTPVRPFEDPDPFQDLRFPSVLMAKRAIAAFLGQPLAKLSEAQRQEIDRILEATLVQKQVFAKVRELFAEKAGTSSEMEA